MTVIHDSRNAVMPQLNISFIVHRPLRAPAKESDR